MGRTGRRLGLRPSDFWSTGLLTDPEDRSGMQGEKWPRGPCPGWHEIKEEDLKWNLYKALACRG